jgi:hypothetical protein
MLTAAWTKVATALFIHQKTLSEVVKMPLSCCILSEHCYQLPEGRVKAQPCQWPMATARYFYGTFAYGICFYGIYFYGIYIYVIYFYRAIKFLNIDLQM